MSDLSVPTNTEIVLFLYGLAKNVYEMQRGEPEPGGFKSRVFRLS